MKKNLVGLVIVSHSNILAEEVINLSKIFKQEEFNIINGGNFTKESYGTTVENVKEAIIKADQGKGVLVFVDMGSSVYNAINAKKELQGKINVEIADAPFLEGVISAAAANVGKITLEELKAIAEDSRNFKKVRE